jgi:hypothetical protein
MCSYLLNLSQLEGFEVLTAVVMNVAIICDTYLCVVHMWTDVSEERITFIFRVENQPCKKAFSRCLPWRWRLYVPPKRRFRYGLHGDISQKMTTFLSQYISVSISTLLLRYEENAAMPLSCSVVPVLHCAILAPLRWGFHLLEVRAVFVSTVWTNCRTSVSSNA